MATSDHASVDVVVVGAGLSGLSAAQLLSENGQRVLVLEARERVGGRTYTFQSDKTGPVDLGAAYVGPTQNRVLKLARKLGVKTYLTNNAEDVVFHFKKRSVRMGEGNVPPAGGLLAWLDLNNIIRLINKMAQQIPLDAPWKAPQAAVWDKMTVQQFFDQHVWTRVGMQNAQFLVQVNVTSEPYEVSLLWFLWYFASAGGPLRINATTNGGQERKFVGGTQQLSEGLARSLGKDKVLLGRPVNHIHQDSSGVVVTDSTGNTYKAKHCVVALAPPLQSRISWSPEMPANRNQLMQRAPMGSVIKTFMYYNLPFWRHQGLCGTAIIFDEDDGLVKATMDHVQHDGSYPALMGFVVSDIAKACSRMTKEERRDRIARLYAKVFKTDQALHPVHYEEMNWCGEQWSGGCYTVMMPPGFLTTMGPELREPVGRVHFAGTETASQWSGYMEGAIQAGERAAREILNKKGLVSADAIWQDEAEDEEVRARPLEFSFLERVAPSVPTFLRLMLGVTLLTSGIVLTTCRHRFLRG